MLVLPRSTDNFAKSEAGGKGYNLYVLSHAGLPVPEGLVLDDSAQRLLSARRQMESEHRALAEADQSDPAVGNAQSMGFVFEQAIQFRRRQR